jgi:predicted nucleic acid-binding protein
MILCDTGALICFIDPDEPKHLAYKKVFLSLPKPFTTTWGCLSEAMYLAGNRGGWRMQKQLGKLLTEELLIVYEIIPDDYELLLALMEKYCDRPMDLADASLVLAAEKTGCQRILTIDSDFFIYRLQNGETLEIIATE